MKNIRYFVFFGLDMIKGSPVKNNIEDIERIYKQKDHTQELINLLKYVRENIPFFSNIEKNELKSFPVVNKAIIRRNFDAIFNSSYNKDTLHHTITSGSTGEPFRVYQDANKRNRTIADLMRMFHHFCFFTGDRYVFVRSWVKHYDSSKKTQLKQNFIPVDVNTFDSQAKENLRQRLKKDKKITALISYGSALEDLLRFLEKNSDSSSMFNLKVVVSCSDTLKPEVKALGEKIFGCPVINRYSNEECGIMGYSQPYSDEIVLNIASYHFELLNIENDEPVKPGELGRLVVTDLFNKAMPLIRYDTGDLAISDDSGENVKTIKTLVGRIADSLLTDSGILISGVTLSSYMQSYSESIEKYQLLCNEKNDLVMSVVMKGDDTPDIKKMLTELFGTSRKIEVVKVDDIPLEKNGKFKQIINKYRG